MGKGRNVPGVIQLGGGLTWTTSACPTPGSSPVSCAVSYESRGGSGGLQGKAGLGQETCLVPALPSCATLGSELTSVDFSLVIHKMGLNSSLSLLFFLRNKDKGILLHAWRDLSLWGGGDAEAQNPTCQPCSALRQLLRQGRKARALRNTVETTMP